MTQQSDQDGKNFFTPQQLATEQIQKFESPRGRFLIASCCSGSYLADKVVEQYANLSASAANGRDSEVVVPYLRDIDFQFSDSETCVRLDIDVSGYDVFLFQALYDPTGKRSVDQNYMAFLIAVRTFREWGANHVTALLPYLAYGRQDKPTKYKREPTTAKLVADFSKHAGLDRLVIWHPHQNQVHGLYGSMPIHVLESLAILSETFDHFRERDDVIAVAPDAGASKFVTYFSRALKIRSAIASKYRPRPEESTVAEVIGDFANKKIAIVLDDIISSGGTMYGLVKRLIDEKGVEEVYIGASHNLCTDQAYDRLLDLYENYHLKEVIVTNSIPQTEKFQKLPFISIICLSDRLSRVINRIHYNRSVSNLFDST